MEQTDNGCVLEGAPGDPPGCATLTGAKFQSFSSSDPGRNNVLDIRGYRGQVFVGPYQYYQEPKRMRIRQQGDAPVDLVLWASSWYGATPDLQLSAAAQLTTMGNEFYGSAPGTDPDMQQRFFSKAPTAQGLPQLSRALDELRRLGAADLHLNHPGFP